MPFFQPRLHPLPTGIDLKGRVAVITGASSGMGLEAARQLLVLNISTVVLAVRNPSKAEGCRLQLLADPAVKKTNPNAEVKIMKVDMGDYTSVSTFADSLVTNVPVIDYLLLNAGIGVIEFVKSPTGHESTAQVNYLSNVLLLAKTLPHLEASSDKTGRAVRIGWVGSRRHETPSWASKKPVKENESIISYLDNPENFGLATKYGDSKTLCAMFMYELAPRLNPEKVFIDMMCPGMVTTSMGSDLPIYIRAPVAVARCIRGRSAEEGAWVVLNATLVAGDEAHGRFLLDNNIQE